MRGEFRGGVCDGHTHPIGPEPAPETLASPCSPRTGGRYVLSGRREVSELSTTELAIYEWEPAGESPLCCP
jgi:hypothetical protein